MEFTSYEMVAANTASLNTGSYLNRTEYSLFVKGFTTDLWYGLSAQDAIEFGVWDRDQNLIGWNVLNQSKSYTTTVLSYLNAQNLPVTYSYSELLPDFILYKNEDILVSPPTHLSESLGILSGSYYFDYNFIREMAGSNLSPLIIKEISPSRKELKLIPLGVADKSYDAFCNKKILLQDVSPLYLSSIKSCPYSQIYNTVSPKYTDQINAIKNVFYLTSDGAMVDFLKNLYEDLIIYNFSPDKNQIITGSLTKIQGIQSYFINYLLSNSGNEVDFVDIDNTFNVYVSASIERKFSPIGSHPQQQYVDAKAFVYDFFTKYFYQPVSDVLSRTYKEKYFSYLRNALNVGNNRLFPILQHGMMDERVSTSDPLTLLVRLKDELPSDLDVQVHCWVSNVSLSPYVLNSIVKSPGQTSVYKIGIPNFSLPIPNVSLTNTNTEYTAADLENNDEDSREVTISKNISELNVDYTDFKNFVVFSSAEVRLKIFKNKVINISTLSSSINSLNEANDAFISVHGTSYPFYTSEYNNFQGKLNDIVNSFDGYESYLYRSGDYKFVSGSFVSASFIADMAASASAYDKYNRDSLINNCPSHILADEDNDDYIIFLSMIGHFFDQIYEYISNIPSERQVGHGSTNEFTRRVVDYMLQTFGWNLDDILDQNNILENYLTQDQLSNLNAMSSEERLKTVRNRMLISLPKIYKTKGTEESVRLLMACYGIPSTLLSVREYGGVNYTDEHATYTAYERAYMYHFDTSSQYNYFQTNLTTNAQTYVFKIGLDNSNLYQYGQEIAVMGVVNATASLSSSNAGGEWAIGFVREKSQNAGKIWFRIGDKDAPLLKMYSGQFPLFDGDIYSVMLRRNVTPPEYDFNVNIDAVPSIFDLYVQKNEFGRQILQITSSVLSFDYDTNRKFSVAGSGSHLVWGGWFTNPNGAGFHGLFDKFQVWYDALPNSNFYDYVNSINSYSFSGSRQAHQSLMFRMHTDYPFDLQASPNWRNANPFYAIDSQTKQENLLTSLGIPPTYAANMDFATVVNPWSGSQKLINDVNGCSVSQSVYPFQFKVVDYPSTWGVSKYGPNKFRNEKIHHVSQSIEARFDDKERSTFVDQSGISKDSNQIGFFADPQDFKNKDIVRYFGNFNFMDSIGDPSNQYSSSYDTLKHFRKQYATARNQYSGSNTYFNELITMYKLYFNRSIFESIKNLVPARSNALVGVIIEPTLLERPRYPIKPLFTEMNSGSAFYADVTASHYRNDPNTKLLRLSMSIQTTASSAVNLSYVSLPLRDYPVNYGGNYISDMPDDYGYGHFADGVFIGLPSTTSFNVSIPTFPPTASFVMSQTSSYAPVSILFGNMSDHAILYEWDLGDGTILDGASIPSHEYLTASVYTITLQAFSGSLSSSYSQTLSVLNNPLPTGSTPPVIIPCVAMPPTTIPGGLSGFPRRFQVQLGNDVGHCNLAIGTLGGPSKFKAYISGTLVLDTGYLGDPRDFQALQMALFARGYPPEGINGPPIVTATYVKATTYPYVDIEVWSPIGSSGYVLGAGCPFP